MTVTAAGIGEGDAANPLAAIEAKYDGISIGSYPFFNKELRGVSFVARGRDMAILEDVEKDLKGLVASLTNG